MGLQTFLKLFAIKSSGLIILSTHQWQFGGMDFQIQQMLQNGTKKDIFGKDGHNLGQIFHYFQLTDQSNLDKIFKV
jgi:hypothetical protein